MVRALVARNENFKSFTAPLNYFYNQALLENKFFHNINAAFSHPS